MKSAETPVKTVHQDTPRNAADSEKSTQVSPDLFYRKLTSRPDIRELLKRLAKR